MNDWGEEKISFKKLIGETWKKRTEIIFCSGKVSSNYTETKMRKMWKKMETVILIKRKVRRNGKK